MYSVVPVPLHVRTVPAPLEAITEPALLPPGVPAPVAAVHTAPVGEYIGVPDAWVDTKFVPVHAKVEA